MMRNENTRNDETGKSEVRDDDLDRVWTLAEKIGFACSRPWRAR